MNHTTLAEHAHAAEQQDLLAILDVSGQDFCPSALPDPPSLSPDISFVGDLVQIFPPEVVDIIFTNCRPQDVFSLRNVSKTWNSYLSRPEFLQRMDHQMYANGGQYLLDSDTVENERRSFEDCVRHRCALSNGRACMFEHIQNEDEQEGGLQFCSGTLLQWTPGASKIYVKRLYENYPEIWDDVLDEGDRFSQVRLTSRYVLACNRTGEFICWDREESEVIARFLLTSMSPISGEQGEILGYEERSITPIWIGASSCTIVMITWHGWHLYSLATNILTEVGKLVGYEEVDSREVDWTLDESGFLYFCGCGNTGGRFIDVFKINETSSAIDFVSRIHLYTLLLRQLDSVTPAGAADSAKA